jgi:hypothetical protein
MGGELFRRSDIMKFIFGFRNSSSARSKGAFRALSRIQTRYLNNRSAADLRTKRHGRLDRQCTL